MKRPKDERKAELWHQSGVNAAGEPFVQLTFGGRVIAQMDTHQAREHARAILESAEAAEQDAFLMDWVTNHVGAQPAQAAGLLRDFRAFREQRGKATGPSDPNDWVMPDGVPS